MSRTNPYKRKRRSASKTILIYGEGLDEETFLKHLRGIYSKNKNIAITIRKGKGGSVSNLVMDAYKSYGVFNKKAVVLDNDRGVREMRKAREEAKKKCIELYEHTPCLESVFLSIMTDGKSFKNKPSNWCKQEFKSKHLARKKRNDLKEYTKLMPKKLLDKQITKIPELKKLISLMRGRFK
ncbi:MAG TPA: hypothetical protein VMW29_01825 [Candidatus Bathyarchaeia archaeon]|nr:hypothetical protein [Candidatus Bathyarchaeia archaeon]